MRRRLNHKTDHPYVVVLLLMIIIMIWMSSCRTPLNHTQGYEHYKVNQDWKSYKNN